jgi:broad specificity phosphatase PhoE
VLKILAMTRFFLVRHGETAWNKQEVFRGQKDIPLNEMGKFQAEKTANKLQKEPIDAIYSSPLARAKETAQAIHKHHGAELIVEHRLTDIHFGKWQGLPHEEVKNSYPKLYTSWKTTPHTVTFPDGESLLQGYKRAKSLVEEISQQNRHKTVVLTSHRVLCKVLTCFFLDLDLSRFWFVRHDVCALSLFETHGSSYITLKLNDTCHLEGLKNNGLLADF